MAVNMEVHQLHQCSGSSAFMAPLSSITNTSSSWILSPLEGGESSPVSSSSEDYAGLLVPGRVTASSAIPQGAMTLQIEPWMLLGKVEVQQISVDVTSFGTLDLDRSSKEIWNKDVHWIRAIRLAEDCHSYNVELKLQPPYRLYPNLRGGTLPKLVLQTVRPIQAGQELQMWFSEDILATMQVVFLNPANIQGDKKYRCTHCSKLYESPNPLKLHITLACGTLPISELWQRLVSTTKNMEQLRPTNTKSQTFEFQLTPRPPICKQKNALDLSVGADPILGAKGLYRAHSECSAFRPVKKPPAGTGPTPAQDLPGVWPMSFDSDIVQLHRNLMHHQALTKGRNFYNDDAQIESLVSSLGKASQGHICLYCGKCYSRKYGLKIHIRTHTGYKPLRCKFCDRPFGDPSNLNKHVRLHAEGNTPYKCHLCGKILVRRRDLDRHLKARHVIELHQGQSESSSSPPHPESGGDNAPSNLESPKEDDETQAVKDEISDTRHDIEVG